MKRLAALFSVVMLVALVAAAPAGAVTPEPNPVKINWLGLYAHPDDDTGIIAPCGVLKQVAGMRCAVLAFTRGEGGGNAVGPETRQALGIRRENEERVAQAFAGTTDVIYLDAPDFFYNTSAPLTEYFWGHDSTLSRVVRIIRETQPDIISAHSPTGGHGNHQEVGRMAWEAVKAAADPNMFPEQLTGPNALKVWQVKKLTSGGSASGSVTAGVTGAAADSCVGGFTQAATNLDNVSGIWTGYTSPYQYTENNPQGQPVGSYKLWSQVASEATAMYPTQARNMSQNATPTAAGCSRFGVNQVFVPFQPIGSPTYGNDVAILYGASIQDPGGMPLGSLFYLTFDTFYNVAGQQFQVTVHAKSGGATMSGGSVALTVPAGWSVTEPSLPLTPVMSSGETTATFHVTAAAGAAAVRFQVAANFTAGGITGYTNNVMQIVPPVEGRAERYQANVDLDQWIARTGSYRFARSTATTPIGVGETISVPVNLHNWSTVTQSGNVTLTLPAGGGFAADALSKPYTNLAAGADATVTFNVTNTNIALVTGKYGGDPTANGSFVVTVATSYNIPAASSSESLNLNLVPDVEIPAAASAPVLDGVADAVYTGAALDLSRQWEGSNCSPDGTDCGTGTFAKVVSYGDALYFFIHVVDDVQGTPVVPSDCLAHWRTDSVEILLDPRGDAANTSATFKAGIFPYTNDPTGAAGNGVNGACWERDADNYQGYGAVTAPGMQVFSTATLNDGRTYAGGAYNLEVKIPLADLPAAIGPTSSLPTADGATNAVDPIHLGLNITPYDSDTQDLQGQTRLAWSPFGGVQGDPYLWGHAYLTGYTPPAGRPTTPIAPIIDATGELGVNSPQSVYMAANNGTSLAGWPYAAGKNELTISRTPTYDTNALKVNLKSYGTGTARIWLWTNTTSGPAVPLSIVPNQLTIPVYNYPYFTTTWPLSNTANIPPWAPDMTGRVLRKLVVPVDHRTETVKIALDSTTYNTIRTAGAFVLVSWAAADGSVQAFSYPIH